MHSRRPPLPRPLVQEVGADPGRLRIGFLDHPAAEGFLDDPQCRAAVAATAALLESLGHHVEEFVAPWSGVDLDGDFTVAFGPEPRTAAGMGRKLGANEMAVPYYEAVPKGPY